MACGKRGSIVQPIAHHQHPMPRSAQPFDQRQLVLRAQMADRSGRGLARNLGQRFGPVAAGDQRLEAHGAQVGQRLDRVGPQGIGKAQQHRLVAAPIFRRQIEQGDEAARTAKRHHLFPQPARHPLARLFAQVGQRRRDDTLALQSLAQRNAQRMATALHQGQQDGAILRRQSRQIARHRTAQRQRAGLVEQRLVHFRQPFERRPVLDQHPALHQRAARHDLRRRHRQP